MNGCRYNLQQEVVRYTKSTQTSQQTTAIVEYRNVLKRALRGFEKLRSIYMPGLVQFLTDIDEDLSLDEDGQPENAKLWLPSAIPTEMRDIVCADNVDTIEERLRRARAYDALDGVRHTLRVKTKMVQFKNKNIWGQWSSGKSREVIDRVHQRVKTFVERYRRSRAGLLQLVGPGVWEEELRVMEQGDVRSYVDVEAKSHGPGRRGTNEEEPGMEGVAVEEPTIPREDEDERFHLQSEDRARRDGTGETRKVQSWIWLTRQINLRDGADENDNEILRAEWCRSRARVHRTEEEVQYLEAEMERSLRFLDWRAVWWDKRKSRPNTRKVPQLEEGVKAYAIRQAEIQRGLRGKFLKIWNSSLRKEEEFKGQEEAIQRAAREELGLDGRDDDDEDNDDEAEDLGTDKGDRNVSDKIEEEGEEENAEAESFGFA